MYLYYFIENIMTSYFYSTYLFLVSFTNKNKFENYIRLYTLILKDN